MTTATYKLLGVTDDETTCRCCGKENLKRTVRLGLTDPDGNVVDVTYFGCDCASKALKQKHKPTYGNQNLNPKKVLDLAKQAGTYHALGYHGMDRLYELEAV